MALSVLAAAVYDILRSLVPDAGAEITYSMLVNELGSLPAPNQDLTARDVRLYAALDELVDVCRERDIPAISALVVRADSSVPGAGYFQVAHPRVRDKAYAMVAWGQEVAQVRQTTYPAQL